MGKLETFRKVMALPEVMQNVELAGVLKELHTDYLELLEKYNETKKKLNDLGSIADIKKKAKVKNGFYTIEDIKDNEGKEIPFCLNCLYEYGLQIPMLFGVIERGKQDLLSGRTVIPTTYGFSCKKCETKLVTAAPRKT